MIMISHQEFCPDWVSAPGETIIDILRERGLSVDEFARHMRQSPEETKNLLQGRTAITLGIARRLKEVIGASPEFWMARDFQYRQDVTRKYYQFDVFGNAIFMT
jgi:HTH-type transcriptional regulator/antitoxin HigA